MWGGLTAEDQRKSGNGIPWRIFKGSEMERVKLGKPTPVDGSPRQHTSTSTPGQKPPPRKLGVSCVRCTLLAIRGRTGRRFWTSLSACVVARPGRCRIQVRTRGSFPEGEEVPMRLQDNLEPCLPEGKSSWSRALMAEEGPLAWLFPMLL